MKFHINKGILWVKILYSLFAFAVTISQPFFVLQLYSLGLKEESISWIVGICPLMTTVTTPLIGTDRYRLNCTSSKGNHAPTQKFERPNGNKTENYSVSKPEHSLQGLVLYETSPKEASNCNGQGIPNGPSSHTGPPQKNAPMFCHTTDA